jgi:hypothetical protein
VKKGHAALRPGHELLECRNIAANEGINTGKNASNVAVSLHALGLVLLIAYTASRLSVSAGNLVAI